MKKTYYVSSLFIILLIISLIIYKVYNPEDKMLSKNNVLFLVENNKYIQKINYWFDESSDCYYVFIPSFTTLEDVQVLPEKNTTIKINNLKYKNLTNINNINSNEEYKFEIYNSKENINIKSKIKFLTNDDKISTMFINTKSGSLDNIISDKNYKETGKMMLINEEGNLEYNGSLNYVKGRGNATWARDKKPLNIQLKKSSNLLNLGSGKNWSLIANMIDRTHLRNKIILDFANNIGLDYSPNSEYVNLYINGDYLGLYLLTEKVEIKKNRVDIDSGDKNETGPYLLERDVEERFNEESNGFITSKYRHIVIKNPDRISEKQKAYISNLWQQMEDAIYSNDDSYKNYIDTKTWVKKYLIEEVFGNFDANNTSVFFYKKNNSVSNLIYAGPVWDYDGAIGTVEKFNTPTEFLVNIEGTYWNGLLNKEDYKKEVIKEFNEIILPTLEKYMEYEIPQTRDRIYNSAKLDYFRWKNSELGDAYMLYNTYEENYNFLVDFLNQRKEFLKSEWSN